MSLEGAIDSVLLDKPSLPRTGHSVTRRENYEPYCPLSYKTLALATFLVLVSSRSYNPDGRGPKNLRIVLQILGTGKFPVNYPVTQVPNQICGVVRLELAGWKNLKIP